jgi:hypothetical protein
VESVPADTNPCGREKVNFVINAGNAGPEHAANVQVALDLSMPAISFITFSCCDSFKGQHMSEPIEPGAHPARR